MNSPKGVTFRELALPGPGHYGVALFLLLASIFLVMAFPKGTILDALALVLQMFALIACLRAAETAPHLVRIFEAFAILAAVIGITPWIFGNDIEKDLVRGATFLLVLTALPSITIGLVRQLKRDRAVTIRTVFGALCTYLLLIIAFAAAFGIVSVLESSAFFVQGYPTNQYGDFVYFSVTTITTLGIGDLTPATDFGRALTGLLTLIGQIYMVTVVALIVGNLGFRSDQTGRNGE